jgi:3-deoxy-D-manno-octulosonic-acid transferase
MQAIALPFFVLYLTYRWLANKNVFGSVRERVGFVRKTPKNKNIAWFHAVSVGEVLSIQHIIEQIKAQKPATFIYLTVGTLAGKDMAQKNIPADIISFIPYDFLPCMILALYRIKPDKLFVVEAEIWPNMLTLSSWLRVKKYLINARISTRSYGRYKALKFIFAPLFNSFNNIYAQSEQDRQRFMTLKVKPEGIAVLGDIKIFNVYQKWLTAKDGKQIYDKPQQKVLLAGSIHPCELDIYTKLFLNLKAIFPDLKMILAPRHFHWMNELESTLKKAQLAYFMWTTQNSFTSKLFNTHDILVVCKLGELFNLYKMSDIFYLGGTFVNIGGHNLLEPAVWSKACIIGPHHQNTQIIAEQLKSVGGLIKVDNFEQLLQQSQKLLINEELCTKMGQLNFEWLEDQVAQISSSIQGIIKQI